MTVEQVRSTFEAEIAGGRLPTTRPPAPTDLLDKQRYLSQEFADAELARMWACVWQIACVESDVREVGDYYEYTIGKESILVVRERPGDDGVKAYHNVCQHRGRPLKQGCGNAAWTWPRRPRRRWSTPPRCPTRPRCWRSNLEHNKAPGRVPPGKAIATIFGADDWSKGVLEDEDDDLLIKELVDGGEALVPGVGDNVLFTHLTRWPWSWSKSTPGYWERMREFHRISAERDRLVRLAGDYFCVTSLNVATASGEKAAREIIGVRS